MTCSFAPRVAAGNAAFVTSWRAAPPTKGLAGSRLPGTASLEAHGSPSARDGRACPMARSRLGDGL